MHLAQAGRLPEAVNAFRVLTQEAPHHNASQQMLAVLLHQLGRDAEAIDAAGGALDRHPDALPARRALVSSRLRTGDFAQALRDADHPSLLDATAELASTLQDFAAASALHERAALLRARAERHPQDYQAALALAAALHQVGRVSEAIPWCERAHALRSHERQPIEIRAAALIDRGDVEAGLAAYRDLLARGDDADTTARYLVLIHYDPEQTNDSLFEAHRTFVQKYVPAFGPAYVPRPRDPAQPLRVGWLSPRFIAGPVPTFLTDLLRAFDRTRHRHLLIALQTARDASTERLRALADEWIDASGLDNEALLQRLRALDLDVLIDLTGHATANRIAVIAQRAAPVQISWLDWFDTTAIPAMDAWISDVWLTPEDSKQRYTERLIRLDAGHFCYSPHPDTPPATYDGDGDVVFASFNRLAKLNDGVVQTWAEILRRVPDARLALAARTLGDPATRSRIEQRFAAYGIGPERLELFGHRPYVELLAAYRRVDIALDPFPFSGGTTTCDALYMGCPVITVPGETFVSRQTASFNWRLGRDEWVARDRADYVERAVTAASQVASLRAGRTQMRKDVRSRLCDVERQAVEFAQAFRTLLGAR